MSSVVLLFAFALVVVPSREARAAVGAQIVNPTYASGLRYSGQAATSTLKVKNTGTATDTFWVRYSVRDKAGRTCNVPAVPVTLDPGQLSTTIDMTWTVPDPADPSVLTTGHYAAGFSVYDANPDTNAGAALLDGDELPNAFRAHNFIDHFTSLDASRWIKGDHGLGFVREQDCGTIGTATNVFYTTYLNPLNVGLSGTGQLQMRLPSGPSSNPCANVEGAEIESADYYRYGTYEVRMQLPDARSSITGFFLYGATA